MELLTIEFERLDNCVLCYPWWKNWNLAIYRVKRFLNSIVTLEHTQKTYYIIHVLTGNRQIQPIA